MGSGTQELVTIIPWTFIAQILNLFIQMYLIKRFLFKPINEVLQKRRDLADQEIREAREAKEEADGLKVQYEEGLANAKAEAAQIVQSAQKEAQIKADETVKQAQEQAAGIRRKAEADIAQEKKKAINEVKDEIGGLAMDIAGKVVEKGPKTSAGRRDVPIDPDLVKRLRARARTVFGTQKLSKLQGFYVLGDTEGHYYGHHALSRAFHDFADKWEIYGTTGELATFYSLRHTYATMLLRAGVDAKTVASLMGHSSVAMTLNVYASTDPQAKAAAGAVVADLMTQR